MKVANLELSMPVRLAGPIKFIVLPAEAVPIDATAPEIDTVPVGEVDDIEISPPNTASLR